MKIENLKEGMKIKNYRALCELLEEKTKAGNSKISQLREFERYFAYHKDKNAFIIDKIYNEPKQKIYGKGMSEGSRRNNVGRHKHIKPIKGFNVPQEEWYSKGVYKIQLGNKIYIGSTITGFRKRFMEHLRGSRDMMHTYNLLKNGGEFSTLFVYDDNATEEEIRNKEQYYINLYSNNKEFKVINRRFETHVIATKSHKTKSCKTKYTNIKIDKCKINDIITFLNENNIKYISKNMY